jgi:hypothetical protein
VSDTKELPFSIFVVEWKQCENGMGGIWMPNVKLARQHAGHWGEGVAKGIREYRIGGMLSVVDKSERERGRGKIGGPSIFSP